MRLNLMFVLCAHFAADESQFDAMTTFSVCVCLCWPRGRWQRRRMRYSTLIWKKRKKRKNNRLLKLLFASRIHIIANCNAGSRTQNTHICMLLTVVAKNMLRLRVYYLYLYLFLSKTITHLHWPVLRSFHNFKTGNRDWTTNKQQLQSTALVSTATINTWTWVCHYSLCFMRAFVGCAVLVSAYRSSAHRTQCVCSVYAVADILSNVKFHASVLNFEHSKLANAACHIRKSGEKYNEWLCCWPFFMQSLAGASAGCWLPLSIRSSLALRSGSPSMWKKFWKNRTEVRNKFSMRPNKQRGHTPEILTLFHVNRTRILFDDKCECTIRDARVCVCVPVQLNFCAWNGIWSYILLHELNRNACFAYTHENLFRLRGAYCDRALKWFPWITAKALRLRRRLRFRKRQNKCERRKAEKKVFFYFPFFLSFYFFPLWLLCDVCVCGAHTYIWTSTQVQRDNFKTKEIRSARLWKVREIW